MDPRAPSRGPRPRQRLTRTAPAPPFGSAPGPSGDARVVFALVFVQVLFAVHYLAAKVVLDAIPAKAWAVLRILPAAALVLGIALVRGMPRLSARDLGALAFYSIFGVVLNQIFFVEGLARTTPAHSALINTTIPIATILIAAAHGSERLRARRLLGIALSLAGVLVLLRVDRLEARAEWFAGDLLTLANAASFGLFLVISRPVARRMGPVASTAGILAFGSLGIAAAGAGDLARFSVASLPAHVVGLAVFIVLGPTMLTYFLNAWALARVESSQVALYIYLQPVLAAGLSAVFLGESIGPRFFASAALVFAGVFLATRLPKE